MLPFALPSLYRATNVTPLAVFARQLYELAQLVFSTVLDEDDLTRAEFLGHQLLSSVPSLFADFGQKPKFHYAFAHIGTTLRRHGPTPFWSSFGFESRLGDVKRACLLVANNHGVAQRGADIVLESFAVRTRTSRLAADATPLIDWLLAAMIDTDVMSLREQLQRHDLHGTEIVREAIRFEGLYAAFSRESFIVLPPARAVRSIDDYEFVYVDRMCLITGMSIAS